MLDVPGMFWFWFPYHTRRKNVGRFWIGVGGDGCAAANKVPGRGHGRVPPRVHDARVLRPPAAPVPLCRPSDRGALVNVKPFCHPYRELARALVTPSSSSIQKSMVPDWVPETLHGSQ